MYFPINTGFLKTKYLKAVDDVSFSVRRGETLGLVGESGCGKTTLGRTILQLYKPTGGKIVFNGQRVNPPTKDDIKEVTAKRDEALKFAAEKEKELALLVEKGQKDTVLVKKIQLAKSRAKRLTGTLHKMKASNKHYKSLLMDFRKHAQMVFQDPYSSLNPRMTVEDIIAEPLDAHRMCKTKEERHLRVEQLMKAVGLSSEHATRYAHEFSGGQRQRIGIARALALNPELIVCDEPVSALDVSIQAQVINTFKELQKKLHLTYLFVAHNLLVVRHISDRIAVMYLGHIVELSDSEVLFNNPLHPYTKSLLSAIPVPDPDLARSNKRIIMQGDIPSPLNAPSGCPFRTRCPNAMPKCALTRPELVEIEPGHQVSCHLFNKK
ncbi:MAG: ATP-binding cassette domain-containing protein [Erysipelotrichia bacterium]|nr:ATP-binding cassette domain-containing protein [Erysipelotrichia bacterium]